MAPLSLCPPSSTAPLGQRGAALATTLILLVIVTLIALGATRFVAQEEKMAGSIFDRAIAFQSAEAGLRQAETLALPSPPSLEILKPDGTCDQTRQNLCINGLCAPPDPDCPPRWKDPSFTGWISILAGTDATLPVVGFYEYMGNYASPTCSDASSNQPGSLGVCPHIDLYQVTICAARNASTACKAASTTNSGAIVFLQGHYQRTP